MSENADTLCSGMLQCLEHVVLGSLHLFFWRRASRPAVGCCGYDLMTAIFRTYVAFKYNVQSGPP